jgi:hypothetical protein
MCATTFSWTKFGTNPPAVSKTQNFSLHVSQQIVLVLLYPSEKKIVLCAKIESTKRRQLLFFS